MSTTDQLISYPLISISYCVKCKWMLRANWYQQELLQTFSSKPVELVVPTQTDTSASASDSASNEQETLLINSVLLNPSLKPGTFKIALYQSNTSEPIIIWDRTIDGGFPDSKIIKQKIRDVLLPGFHMSHLDKANKNNGLLIGQRLTSEPEPDSQQEQEQQKPSFTEQCLECKTWEG
ncbi:hypothetical protein CANARDRAFT_28542 [[Candida] arabinofermentans NRRL YB-2248]|uniref:Uncharacterized protein n=1 Tax=[Candida] arabinofermentans NRRL YB-2248 TaxID=983967 RepID=A0A1E4T0H9_9ASCO|nr:hypothetical protein CANARDRAFT_28542 [[Candida] arabinofermentans NRRL YB-2248]